MFENTTSFLDAGRVVDSNSEALYRMIFPEIATAVSCKGSRIVWSKSGLILVDCVHLYQEQGNTNNQNMIMPSNDCDFPILRTVILLLG
jgi:hypothetical protein